MVIAAATRNFDAMNAKLRIERRVNMQLSRGWLHRFQKRHKLCALKLCGKSGDVDQAVVQTLLMDLRSELGGYSFGDQFKADDFEPFYRMAPERTISESWLLACKRKTTRMTFLIRSKSTGSDCQSLLIIVHAKRPWGFNKITGEKLGFYYRSNHKAWMTAELFFEWLENSAKFVGMTPGHHVVLLFDSASSHGTVDTIPAYENVRINFLPSNYTSVLGPLVAGIIATLKRRYKKFQYEHAMDAIACDVSPNKVYFINQLLAIQKVEDVWQAMPSQTFNLFLDSHWYWW